MNTTHAFLKSSSSPKEITLTHSRGVAQPSKPASKTKTTVALTQGDANIVYVKQRGVERFAMELMEANPIQLIYAERHGISATLLKDMASKLRMPIAKIFTMVGVPKATAEKKVAAGAPLVGSGGQSAIGLAKLLGIAKSMVDNSTADAAEGFDSGAWLGRWLDVPQPSLGGRKPAELIDTPTGLDMVTRLLASIESGAYQ